MIEETAGAVPIGLVSSLPIRRLGLVHAFEDHPTIKLVVSDVDSILANSQIGYVILDLSQEIGWMDLLLKVRKSRPELRSIIVGPAASIELSVRSIAVGARAYLDPGSSERSLRHAVETVMQGDIWAPRRVLTILIDRMVSKAIVVPVKPEAAPFSRRERQVLDLITSGNSNRQIAFHLGIEERTVKAYVASLFRKVGVENRVSLSVQTIQKANREKREATLQKL